MPSNNSKNGGKIVANGYRSHRDSIDVTGIDWDLEASTNPAQLPEITRMDLHTGSTGSLLSGGVLSPGRKTMKDYEQQQKNLEEENFQMKLRIYMLEERLQGKSTPEADNNMIVDLKVQLATLREELVQKKELLRRASDTLESLEQQYGAELERQQRQAETERQQMQQQIADLQAALTRADLERAALADRSTAEQPYLKAFEPLAVDHAACHSQHELSQLEAKMSELQAALGQMKQTVEEREQESEQLRRQLVEARSSAARLTEQDERCRRLTEQLRQLQSELDGRAGETQQLSEQLQQLRSERNTRAGETQQLSEQLQQLRSERNARAAETQQLTEQLQQMRSERDQSAAEVEQLRRTLEQTEQTERPAAAALEQLQRTCDQLTAGRAADGARLAEMETALLKATDRVKAAAANEATLSAALQTVGAQLVERKAELAASRRAERRGALHIESLIAEQRKLHQTVKQYLAGGGGGTEAATDAGTAPEPDVARLWTELEENKKLIRELQDEKMELVLEKERQIQRLLAQLKERGGADTSSGGVGSPAAAAALHGEQQPPADTSALREAHTQVHSLRSQLAHATLLVGERDSEIGRLRERLLQQRRLLDEPLPAPQLRQRLGQQLGELCAELAAPRPGAPAAAELGGAGEMAADSSQSAAARSEVSELIGSEKTAGLRAQLADLRDQLLMRDRQLAERDERAEEADRLRQALAERERELAAAGRQLAELAGTADQLQAAEHRLAATDTQLVELRRVLASREQELTLAEGQLNEIAELREQLEKRDQQLKTGADQRCELLQVRQLLAERDEEKAALLRHLDQQRRDHEREARALHDRFELTITAPTWEQYREAEARHSREQARLRRRLADTHGAAELLQRRLEQLADFLELLLSLEERGELDLSCLTAQHMADLQRSLVQSRELSQSLTQSLLLGADGALDDTGSSLDASAAAAAEQSSLHVPELEPVRDRSSLQPPTVKGAGKVDVSLRSVSGKPKPVLSSLGSDVDGQLQFDSVNKQQRRSPTAATDKSLQKTLADASTATAAEKTPSPPPPLEVTEASVQAGSVPVTDEQAVQAEQPAVEPAQTVDRMAQTAEEALRPTAEESAAAATAAAAMAAQLETMGADLASRDAQLQQQTQLLAELQQELGQLRALRAQSPARPEVGGGDERTGPEQERAALAVLPGDVRDRFRSLVLRQRTSDRASSTDTPAGTEDTTVQRALSPLLDLARAQSAELLGLTAAPTPMAAKPSRSSGQLMPPPPAPAARSSPVAEAPSSGQETCHDSHKTQERSLPSPPPPAPAEWSESEAWSEPDRDVSLARIGLDQSSLGTRTESWLGQHSDSEARHSARRRQRGSGAQQTQELEAHIESLHQVKDALRAEVDIYRKVLPPGGHRQKHSDAQTEQDGVLVPREVLAEIHSLQQQLERAIVANERIRRQLVRDLSPQQQRHHAAPHEQMAKTLQVTQQRLVESTEQLSASQQRCDELRTKLSRAKDNLRLAQLNAEEFKDKFVRVSDDMVRLRERFNQLETDRERTSEDSRRRRRHTADADVVRRLERQLETAQAALHRQERLSEQLRRQLLQQPETAAEAGPSGSCSETQLLSLNQEKLRLLNERAQLASRGRLLRSESCLLDGEATQAAVQRRLEAAKWAGWELERQQLQAEVGRLRQQLAAVETERARLADEHTHCQRRLAELNRAMQTDKRRLVEVSAQLEEVNAEMDTMRLKLNELDDAGQCWPESARDCSVPPDTATAAACCTEPEPEPATRRNTSESDGHDVHHESDRTSAYSSPDLGIESDCCGDTVRAAAAAGADGRHPQLQPAARESTDVQPSVCSCHGSGVTEPVSAAASEAERLRQERDMMHSKLTATRAALQQALDKLSRADQRKARVERAIYRQLSKTHDILRRAKNNLAPPGAPGGAELTPARP